MGFRLLQCNEETTAMPKLIPLCLQVKCDNLHQEADDTEPTSDVPPEGNSTALPSIAAVLFFILAIVLTYYYRKDICKCFQSSRQETVNMRPSKPYCQPAKGWV
jgi:hypothetical protein